MSASEKLKALAELGQHANVDDLRMAEDVAWAVLPQIAAVVEQVRCRRDPWGYSRCSITATREQMCEACAALAALDEALGNPNFDWKPQEC